MRRTVAAALAGLLLFSVGCSKNEDKIRPAQPFYSINLLPTLLGQNRPEEQPLQLHRKVMKPALEATKAFDAELKGSKSKGDARRKEEGAAAARFLEEAKALRQQLLDPRDALIPYYRQTDYARRYLDALIGLLDNTVRQGKEAKPQPALAGRINAARLAMTDAALGYEHEYKLITTGKGTFDFTLPAFRRLQKGWIYQQVRDNFKMPGTHLKGSTVVKGKNTVRQDDWLWQYGNAFVYVTMENGKAAAFRQEGLW